MNRAQGRRMRNGVRQHPSRTTPITTLAMTFICTGASANVQKSPLVVRCPASRSRAMTRWATRFSPADSRTTDPRRGMPSRRRTLTVARGPIIAPMLQPVTSRSVPAGASSFKGSHARATGETTRGHVSPRLIGSSRPSRCAAHSGWLPAVRAEVRRFEPAPSGRSTSTAGPRHPAGRESPRLPGRTGPVPPSSGA